MPVNGMPTLYDAMQAAGITPLVPILNEVKKSAPELDYLGTMPIPGLSYKTLVRTDLPKPSFRRANRGAALSASVYENRIVSCMISDTPWEVDVAVAMSNPLGAGVSIGMEALAMLRGFGLMIGSQLYYGTANDAEGFPGIQGVVDSERLINATGTTANQASSLYALRLGVEGVQLLLGNNQALQVSDVTKVRKTDSDGRVFDAYRQNLLCFPGLHIATTFAVGRICNLTTENGKGLTDALIYELLSRFPEGEQPDVLFCSRRSKEQLRKSRTATTATGAAAPRVTEVEGIPLLSTDSILNTEAIVA
jgi:hypothetical protein